MGRTGRPGFPVGSYLGGAVSADGRGALNGLGGKALPAAGARRRRRSEGDRKVAAESGADTRCSLTLLAWTPARSSSQW